MPFDDYLTPKSDYAAMPLAERELNTMSTLGARSPFVERITDIVCRAREIIGESSAERLAEETPLTRDLWLRRQKELTTLEGLLRKNWICLDAEGEEVIIDELAPEIYLYDNNKYYFYRDDTALFEVCEQILGASEKPLVRLFGREYDVFYDELKRYFERELDKVRDVYFHSHYQWLIKIRIYQKQLAVMRVAYDEALRKAQESAEKEKRQVLEELAKKDQAISEALKNTSYVQKNEQVAVLLAEETTTLSNNNNVAPIKHDPDVLQEPMSVLQTDKTEGITRWSGVFAHTPVKQSWQITSTSINDQDQTLQTEIGAHDLTVPMQQVELGAQEVELQVIKSPHKTLKKQNLKQKLAREEQQAKLMNQKETLERLADDNIHLREIIQEKTTKIAELTQSIAALEELKQVSHALEDGSKALHGIVQDQQVTIQTQRKQGEEHQKQLVELRETLKVQQEKIQLQEVARETQEKQIKNLKESLNFQSAQSEKRIKEQAEKIAQLNLLLAKKKPLSPEDKSGTQMSGVKGMSLGKPG